MNQLDFFAKADDAESWPTSYRLAGRTYIVTAHVDGVGAITARSSSLWTATCSVRSQIAGALAARSDTMF